MMERVPLTEERKTAIGAMLVSRPMVDLIESIKADLWLETIAAADVIACHTDRVLLGQNLSIEPEFRKPCARIQELQHFLKVMEEISQTGDLIQPIKR